MRIDVSIQLILVSFEVGKANSQIARTVTTGRRMCLHSAVDKLLRIQNITVRLTKEFLAIEGGRSVGGFRVNFKQGRSIVVSVGRVNNGLPVYLYGYF